LELALAGRTDRLDRDLGPVLRVDREAAGDVHRRARLGGLEALGDVLPRDRLDGAGAVADDEPQPVAAVAALSQLSLADAEDPGDRLTVGEVAHPRPLRRPAVFPARDALRRPGDRRLLGE